MRIRIVSRFPSLFLSSLESVSQAGRVRYIVICINPALTKMKDGTENPKSLLSLQNAQRDTNNCAITPTSHLGQNVGLGEGQVGSFPKKDTMILSLLVCPLRQFRSQKETGAS